MLVTATIPVCWKYYIWVWYCVSLPNFVFSDIMVGWISHGGRTYTTEIGKWCKSGLVTFLRLQNKECVTGIIGGPQSLKYLQPVSCPREMKALLRAEGWAGVSWESGGGQCSRRGQRARPEGERCLACVCEGKQRLEEEEGQWAQDLNFSWRTSNSVKLT